MWKSFKKKILNKNGEEDPNGSLIKYYCQNCNKSWDSSKNIEELEFLIKKTIAMEELITLMQKDIDLLKEKIENTNTK